MASTSPEKGLFPNLIPTVQLPGEKGYDTQMRMNAITSTVDASLSQKIPKHFSNATRKHEAIYKGKKRMGS